MSVWTVFFLVVSVVILASPVVLLKPSSTGWLTDRGYLGGDGSGPDRDPTPSENEDIDTRTAGD